MIPTVAIIVVLRILPVLFSKITRLFSSFKYPGNHPRSPFLEKGLLRVFSCEFGIFLRTGIMKSTFDQVPPHPTGIHLFKVNNKNTRTMSYLVNYGKKYLFL